MAARGARPRLALLFGLVAAENALAVALGAMGVLAVFGVTGAPEVVEAGGVVGKSLRNSVTE